jgi:hypothetical protein
MSRARAVTSASAGEDGVFLIDDQLPLTPKIVAAVKTISTS